MIDLVVCVIVWPLAWLTLWFGAIQPMLTGSARTVAEATDFRGPR